MIFSFVICPERRLLDYPESEYRFETNHIVQVVHMVHVARKPYANQIGFSVFSVFWARICCMYFFKATEKSPLLDADLTLGRC